MKQVLPNSLRILTLRQVRQFALVLLLLMSPIIVGYSVSYAADYADLATKSQKLTAQDRQNANTEFGKGFELIKKKDIASAEAAFKNGLAIDPGNGLANFYYGVCLKHRNDDASCEYLKRAAELAVGTKEGDRAKDEVA